MLLEYSMLLNRVTKSSIIRVIGVEEEEKEDEAVSYLYTETVTEVIEIVEGRFTRLYEDIFM